MDSGIRTLRMRYMKEAMELSGMVSRPYLVLPESGVIDGSEDENTLEISFDEMSHDVRQYSYRVLHCNMDWTESDISSYEYLKGFTTADVIDYEHSNNTQQAYACQNKRYQCHTLSKVFCHTYYRSCNTNS